MKRGLVPVALVNKAVILRLLGLEKGVGGLWLSLGRWGHPSGLLLLRNWLCGVGSLGRLRVLEHSSRVKLGIALLLNRWCSRIRLRSSLAGDGLHVDRDRRWIGGPHLGEADGPFLIVIGQ